MTDNTMAAQAAPMAASASAPSASASASANSTTFAIILSLSFCHLLNDMMQSLVPALYPILKDNYALSFSQIGLITLAFQFTASMLQPVVGLYTDRKPQPYSLMIGMGSSVFHPEASRVARMAAGGRYGLAQSLFQVGGNTGSSLGPLLAAWIIVPHGRGSVAWFSLAALLAIVVLLQVGRWYSHHHVTRGKSAARHLAVVALSRRQIIGALAILGLLIFSKYFYLASLSSYYTFYLIHKFGVSVQSAQVHLFVFLFAVAAGSLIGGPVGDRIGRKWVIWVSILGVAPFTLLLPHANLMWTGVLTVIIGLVLASAFSAILVYAQDLLPGRVGMISGLFFGLAFGMGGIGAAVLGGLADVHGIEYVYRLCAYLPLMGLITVFLPNLERPIRA